MKKVAVIAAVVFTTLTVQSCRQSEEVFSPEEAAVLKRVQNSNNAASIKMEQEAPAISIVDGETVPPPKK